MRLIAAAGIVLSLALPAAAQDAQTLADIKQDIAVLKVELQKLNREQSTTGGGITPLGGSALDRLNAIEAELQRMTSKVEQLEFRIGQVVSDGSNRIGDLDFRLCELEPDCDIGSLGDTPLLGGGAAAEGAAATPAPAPSSDSSAGFSGQLAVGEETDFKAADEALSLGDHAGAATLFQRFRESYPGSPLEAAALVGEGRALEGQGDTREAARRYLSAYTNFPDAEAAPEALWRLGVSLAALGSVPEACVTLGEVAGRYPGTDYVGRAQSSMAELGCS
ncbi:tetratricopeptide repeat protein [Ponticoccus litoralis]|uniref:Cell division coordinator CpoB n=1 Tax=Ponticoccus litoralis TaxID=422297 RepID=A0AAW9SAC8_9RHOB